MTKLRPGMKADPERDRITVDGRVIQVSEPPVYVALYKPRGVLSAVTANDPRPTVRDLVNVPGRLYPVGRLDVDSEGLILLTNDGELANRLTHPKFGHKKVYKVLVANRPDEEQIGIWRRGVVWRWQPHRTGQACRLALWQRDLLRSPCVEPQAPDS
jgi:23S rRNA pseudouridine2605 synthase